MSRCPLGAVIIASGRLSKPSFVTVRPVPALVVRVDACGIAIDLIRQRIRGVQRVIGSQRQPSWTDQKRIFVGSLRKSIRDNRPAL